MNYLQGPVGLAPAGDCVRSRAECRDGFDFHSSLVARASWHFLEDVASTGAQGLQWYQEEPQVRSLRGNAVNVQGTVQHGHREPEVAQTMGGCPQ